MNDWKRKELFSKKEKDFTVEVSHHMVNIYPGDEDGPHRWCVYAYIYPAHPLFIEFDSEKIYQDATYKMPLHCGASLVRFHRDGNGIATSVQVGADYNHLGDDFTFCEDSDQAVSVFYDAERLIEWLKKYNSTSEDV